MEIKKSIIRLIKEVYRPYGVNLNNYTKNDRTKKIITCMVNTPFIYPFLKKYFSYCLAFFNIDFYLNLLPKKDILIKNVTLETYDDIIKFLIKNGIVWYSLDHLTDFKPTAIEHDSIHLIITTKGRLRFSSRNDSCLSNTN